MTSAPVEPSAPPGPRRSDLWRLLALVAVAVAVHWWVVSNTAVTARDSVGFARYALALGDPNAGRSDGVARTWTDVLKEEAHPPGYPLAILVAAPVVNATSAASIEERTLAAAQLASAAAGVLLVFPVFWLGRLLFSSGVGFWSALLVQLLPVFARDTSDGLSDGPFLLCMTTALALAVWALDRRRAWPGLLLCGGAAGLAYLVRPEGVLVPVAVGLVLLLRAAQLAPSKAGGGALAVAVGFLAVSGPYMAVIGGFTNKPAFGLKTGEPVGAAGGPLFAESMPEGGSNRTRLMLAVGLAAKEGLKAGHYGVAIYAAVGFLVLFGRVWAEPRFWPAALTGAGHLLAAVAVGFKQGYVSERHMIPLMTLGAVFAVGGLPELFRLFARLPAVGPVFTWKWWPAAVCVLLAGSCVPPLLARQLHEDRLGHKEAGRFLAEAIAALPAEERKRVVVLDHYQWCQYFSGWATYHIPPDPPEAEQRVRFVVLELDKDGQPEAPAFGSERHKQAVALYTSPPPGWTVEVVYQWPQDKSKPPRMVLAKVSPP